MAVSAITSVSGGYARLFRTVRGAEGSTPASETEGIVAPDRNVVVDIDRGQATLDEAELTEMSKRLKLERALGGRSIEVMLEIANLRSRDVAVRTHESAHIAAGDGYIIGGAAYSYQTGPDGLHYAVGGEVGIDTSTIPGKPEETLRKMRIVKAAALAPSQPSSADFAIAAAAAQAEATAMAEVAAARARDMAARYSGEMSASTRIGAAALSLPVSGAYAAGLRDDGPPPTPFDVIA
jgi:hypothetical protein